MDFGQIRDRIDALVTLGGWSNAFPPPDFAFLANEGLRLFTRETQHNIEDCTITTIQNVALYSVLDPLDPRKWISFFDDALYGGTVWISQTTRDKLRVDNRLWRSTVPGTPVWWYWAGPQLIGLYPPPSTGGTQVTLEGPRHEHVMVEDEDTPSFDDEFHEGVCLFGAWHWGKLHARGEDRAIAEGYLTEALSYTSRYLTSKAGQEAGLVVRRVSRSEQEYMGLGARQSPVFWP